MDCYSDLILRTTTDHFYLEPVEASNNILVIDRVTHDITFTTKSLVTIPSDALSRQIFGLLGVIHLIAGPYLVIVKERTRIGGFLDHEIYRVTSCELLCFARNQLHITEQQNAYNRTYESMVANALTLEHYYYSKSWDLTRSLQVQCDEREHDRPGGQSLSHSQRNAPGFALIERADQRFLFNRHLMHEFERHSNSASLPRETRSQLLAFLVPIILGYVGFTLNALPLRESTSTVHDYFLLISRRSTQRAGARFHRRGADSAGEVANLVETEQILLADNHLFSFVQVRGSVPLQWMQRPNLLMKPRIRVQPTFDAAPLNAHVGWLRARYGAQTWISLLDEHGHESSLKKSYADSLRKITASDFRFEHYDFHAEAGTAWSKLGVLIERLEPDLKRFGYLHARFDPQRLRSSNTLASERRPLPIADQLEPFERQRGVFRTNCVDCLDRTNVIQYLLARRALESQLKNCGTLKDYEQITYLPRHEALLRSMWTENANLCSKQYASTGAQKTDFTKTGKRTRSGKVLDIIKSLVRYYRNNFTDGFKQDSIDLLLGAYHIDPTEGLAKSCPIASARTIRFYFLLFVLIISIGMCILSFNIAEALTLQLWYLLFWAACTALILFVIFAYSDDFVDLPRLVKLKLD